MSLETTPTTTPGAGTPPPPVAGAAPPAPAAPPATTPPAPAGKEGATTTAPKGPPAVLGGETQDDKEAPATEPGKEGKPPEAEELTLKLPEGVNENAVMMGEFKPLAKELGLKGEGAQKLLDLHLKALTSLQDQGRAAFEAEVGKWVESMKADKELGGEKFKANLETAQKAINKFGTPGLKELLKSPAISSHPELVRFMVRVGKALAEDSVTAPPVNPGTAAPTEEDRQRTMYPTMFQEPK